LLFPKVQTYKATLHKILDRRLYPNERNGVLSELPAELTRADPRNPERGCSGLPSEVRRIATTLFPIA